MTHAMAPAIYITTSLGSSLIIILIFFNYIGKFNADSFQRKLLLLLLGAAFVAIVADFIKNFLEGNSGRVINNLLYIGNSLYLIAQSGTFYLSALFIDYFTHRNTQRSKKYIAVIAVFLAIYAVSVIASLPYGYYFSISVDNKFEQGKWYPISLALSYGSVLLILINMLFSIKYFKHTQFYSIMLFVTITVIGSLLDIMFKSGSLVWSCFAATVLYMYLFIIQSDLKIDGLTRIGNRASFSEFIDKLSRQNSRMEYTIVMIDLDRFKEINDTLGHLEGDNALRDIAMILKSCIRNSDFAARYGGDEFILAIEAEYDIQRVMNRIQDTINQQNESRSRPYQLYISYGYDVYATKSGEPISEFLARIDTKMYQQKDERKKRGIPSTITSKLSGKKGGAPVV